MKFTYNKNRDRSALTLIELLVSTAILSMMILLFSMVLNSTQKVTSTAHATMRGNAAAAAIADAIRKDFARITRNGFLCIRQQVSTMPVSPATIFFTTSGPSPSVTGPEVGPGMIVSYGIDTNGTLWRRGWILDPVGTSPDVFQMSASELYASSGPTLQLTISSLSNDVQTNGLEPIPVPGELDGIDRQWQILALNCSDLSITWADGSDYYGAGPAGNTNDGHVDWYGIRPDAFPAIYDANDVQAQGTPAGSGITALNTPELTTSPYDALWTRDGQAPWPQAIKISFVIIDPDMPEQLQGQRYEVICPIN